MPRKGKLVVAAIAALALVALFWPWKELVVPEWTVTVTTESGEPAPNVPVGEWSQHWTVETQSHAAKGVTDRDGRIVFPPRYVTMCALRIALGSIWNVIQFLHEASFGPSGHVMIGVHEGAGRKGCELLVYPRGLTPVERAHTGPLKDHCIVPDTYSTFAL